MTERALTFGSVAAASSATARLPRRGGREGAGVRLSPRRDGLGDRRGHRPRYTILNVGVTEDVARAKEAVRAVWGGALCVTEFANTQDRLREVAEELRDLPGNLGPQFGSISNRVELPVVHDDGSIRAWVDEEYGEDVVEVTSALEPVG